MASSASRALASKKPPLRPRQARGLLWDIDTSGHLLLALLNDLLDLAKLESGKIAFDFQPTDLNPLLGVVVTVSDQGVGIPAGEEGAIFDSRLLCRTPSFSA